MAQNNNLQVDTVVSNKPGLVTDLNSSYISEGAYSYARNAVKNSKDGDLGTIGNEPSNDRCFSAPYQIIGTVTLPDDTILIFSGDKSSSEIGIGNPKDCSYTALNSMTCLNFNPDYPITGVAKKNFHKGITVTFTDKYNPVRRVELKTLSKVTDCDDILLFKKITHPCITVTKGQIGNMPNGSYSVVIAYVVDGQVFSDYYSITNRIQLHSVSGANSLQVTVDNLDKEFEEYAVVVVGNYVDPVTKGATKLAKHIGNFSTKVKTFPVTDFINTTYPNVPLSTLVTKKNTWQKAGIINSNSNYLILADLVGRTEENYQLKAMSITAEYVIDQVESNYYENDGVDVGYYRDENYDFYIQGIYNTGEETDKYHIPGRVSTSFDRQIVSSSDVYEYDTQFGDCADPGKIERWQVENTASDVIPLNGEFYCGRREYGHGVMGYFQSTDLYADNADMFGVYANTPIRFHKMPDECKMPRYSVINGKSYVNIIGVRFSSIPSFDNPDIVGYKITRSDRKGGNGTVVARGLMTNLRSYTDSQTNQEVLYSNYPVNDLSPDQYLSSTQSQYKNGQEQDFTPLTNYYKDQFSFYSPHTSFEPRYSLGTEIKIESEEVADITGQFEIVHNHPKEKLMNQFSFWLSAAVGFIEATLITLGKNTHIQKKQNIIGTAVGLPLSAQVFDAEQTYNINSVEDLVGLDIIGFVKSKILALDSSAITVVKNIITVIASLGIKIPYAIFGGIREADQVFDIMYKFTGYTDYVYQYNAHALFNRSICVEEGNKRRRLLRPATYIPSDIVSIDDKVYNNYFREKTVYLQLNKEIKNPTTVDTSRNTATGFGVCDDLTKKTTSVGSAFYATNKVVNPNQYGELGSCNAVSMHSCVLTGDTTPTLYGGDCVITRFQFLKKMQFFNQNIANTNYPDGTEYDYRLYRNIGYPRFWMDTTKYDFSKLLSSNVVNYTRFSRTTAGKYNLDCKGGDGKSITRIDDAYMYLSNNAAIDFFVEADYNVGFREKGEHPFYSKENTNLSQIFRSDRLEFDEEFLISRVYSDLYTAEIYAQQQRINFDPLDPIPAAQPNSVIYSLPSFNLQEVDNWQYFLPSNFFAFKESDFGELTAIHNIDQDRLIFLFSKASPYVTMGRSLLELSNQTVTIGDGGLFAQDPREMMPTDNNYGACTSRYAFSNTHMGRYYPSAVQGRIILSDNVEDIARQGISYWCKNYMPIFLYNYFPNYPKVENPINGVGYLSVFDSFNETVYITKRDFSPKRELAKDITYDGVFRYKGLEISVRDLNYFNDISWTLSYSPGDRAFVSYHDWHPDWVIQTENHFMTIKGNTAWKHNERYDDFCNFYGEDYPYEFEAISTSGQQVETVRSIEYLLEVYTYKNSGRDRFHVLNQNFDRLLVKNTEQISPLLNLSLGNPNPEQNLAYPKKASNLSYDIVFFKEENKYRINQFWDTVKDRGEFSTTENHLFPTDESGYKSVLNPVAINIDKPEEQRKKFRHYFNQFRLIKTVSGPYKFINKILNIKKQISQR